MLVDNFKGIVPRLPAHRLGAGFATVAHNVNLIHGTLKPWREPLPVATLPPETKTIYQYGCCYFGWDACVTVARWLPDCPRLYITGRMPYPEVAVVNFDDCTLDYGRLGVPSPAGAPLTSHIPLPEKGEDSSERAYVFTYVNWLGEEGAPSYPSESFTINDGDAVTISGWGTPSAEYRIERVRVYRMESGFRDGREKEQTPQTEWLLVDDIPIGQATLIDRKKALELGSALSTREVAEPPANLRDIVAVSDSAILAGFAGNRVYFSRNGQPWNWQADQELTLDEPIAHLIEQDGTVFATTNGVPYSIQGDAGCEERVCRPLTKHDTPFPDIACGYVHSAIATPFGAVYASKDGLVLLSPGHQPTLLTNDLFARDDWRRYRPDTTRLAYTDGFLFVVTEAISFVLLMDLNTYKEDIPAHLSTIDDKPQDMVTTDAGELLMLNDGRVSQWNAGTTYRPYMWVSFPIETSGVWFTAMRAKVTGGTTSMLYSTEGGASFDRVLPSNVPFRIPPLGRALVRHMHFSGVGELEYFRLATTMNKLGGS